jgi:hypothetical protein
MRLGAALLQHPLPIGPLLSVTRLKDDLVLLSFGQRLAFFGNHSGRSCASTSRSRAYKKTPVGPPSAAAPAPPDEAQAKATKKCVADITATDLARPNGPPPHHALAALEDRSMSEENKQCSICFRRYTEFGHPAEPVRSGRCCNVCNNLVVMRARLRAMREAREREQDQQN